MKRRNLYLFIVSAVLVWVLFLMPCFAFDGQDHLVTATGKIHYTEMQALVNMINDYRAERGLQPCVYDAYLQQDAITNAFESMLNEEHEGTNHKNNSSYYNYIATQTSTSGGGYNENLAVGNMSAQTVFNIWKNSTDGHHGAMLMPESTAIAVGCVSTTVSDTKTWIMLVGGGTPNSAAPITNGTRTEERNIYVSSRWFNTFKLSGNGCQYGKTNAAHYFLSKQGTLVGYGMELKLPQSNIRFSSTSDAVRVDPATGAITGRRAGSFPLTMKVDGIDYTATFTCSKRSLLDDDDLISCTLSSKTFTYTGKPIKPAVTVTDGSKTLTEGVDYELQYVNNINPGRATVYINGIGNYEDSWAPDFNIIADERTEISTLSFNIDSQPIRVEETGRPITLDGILVINDGPYTLVKDFDYTASYTNNIIPGTAIVTLNGIGGYKGSVNKSFTITKSSSVATCNIADVADVKGLYSSYNYTGFQLTPSFTVTHGSKTLTYGNDYSVKYSNNTAVGTAVIEISGMGNYTGSIRKTFIIVKKESSTGFNLSKVATISGLPSKVYYTGKAITPGFKVMHGSRILTKGIDYVVTYSSNRNIGTATITVTGKGNYTGSLRASVSILPKTDISSKCTVDGLSASYYYTGKAVYPSVKVRYGNTTLKPGTDYTIRYTNNIKIGTAKLTVTGKEKYSGSITKSFKIIQKPSIKVFSISSLKATGKKGGLYIKWKKDKTKTTSFFQIQVSEDRSFRTKVKSVTVSGKSRSVTVKNLNRKKYYYVRVRAVRKVGTSYYYGTWKSISKKTK